MRSRDGNRSLTRTICSLILLNFLAYPSLVKAEMAQEFLISYRYMIKDATLYNETLYISKSMKKCSGIAQKPLILPNNKADNLKLIISNNFEEFLAYIHKLGLYVEHREKTLNYQNSSTTTLTLKTTCFKVDFNENFAKISPLK